MAIESGMAENPGQSYSIASRLICAKCGCEPSVVKAEGSEMLTITVKCHGSTQMKTFSKNDLVFTQRFFENE